jgi:hypothetical protein
MPLYIIGDAYLTLYAFVYRVYACPCTYLYTVMYVPYCIISWCSASVNGLICVSVKWRIWACGLYYLNKEI